MEEVDRGHLRGYRRDSDTSAGGSADVDGSAPRRVPGRVARAKQNLHRSSYLHIHQRSSVIQCRSSFSGVSPPLALLSPPNGYFVLPFYPFSCSSSSSSSSSPIFFI
ncbi:hypothetical protein L249_3508, partial [Ophiocordyceps polyrhachis-furcata BCC 54312]